MDSINWPAFFVGLAFSAVGFIYFSYGKKLTQINMVVTGISLMVYSYFVDSITMTAIVGAVLTVLPFIFKWWR